jgi:hypothetical protein
MALYVYISVYLTNIQKRTNKYCILYVALATTTLLVPTCHWRMPIGSGSGTMRPVRRTRPWTTTLWRRGSLSPSPHTLHYIGYNTAYSTSPSPTATTSTVALVIVTSSRRKTAAWPMLRPLRRSLSSAPTPVPVRPSLDQLGMLIIATSLLYTTRR